MGEASGDYFRASGVHAAGEKYFCLRFSHEDGLLYGKKGASGITIAKSGQCLVVGIYGEGMTPSGCNMATEGLKDYLISQGY